MDPNGPASYKLIHTFLNSETEPTEHKWQHLSSQPMKLSEISKEVESSKSIEKLNNIIKFERKN